MVLMKETVRHIAHMEQYMMLLTALQTLLSMQLSHETIRYVGMNLIYTEMFRTSLALQNLSQVIGLERVFSAFILLQIN